jgi:hypothetical protein
MRKGFPSVSMTPIDNTTADIKRAKLVEAVHQYQQKNIFTFFSF